MLPTFPDHPAWKEVGSVLLTASSALLEVSGLHSEARRTLGGKELNVTTVGARQVEGELGESEM